MGGRLEFIYVFLPSSQRVMDQEQCDDGKRSLCRNIKLKATIANFTHDGRVRIGSDWISNRKKFSADFDSQVYTKVCIPLKLVRYV